MKEGKLRVSQRELHRMHVVRLTIEGLSCPTNSEQLFAADKSEFLTVLC